MKTCSKCNQSKDFGDFYKHKNGKDGLDSRCKTCLVQYRESRVANSSISNKAWYESNKEQKALYNKIWKKANLKHYNNYEREHKKNRYKIDPEYRQKQIDNATEYAAKRLKVDLNFRLSYNLRSRLYRAIKNTWKVGSAVDDLGCTIEELKKHLESKFKPGMTWENHSKDGWHIDHIKPLASFNLSNPDQFKEACNYTNLQPLWAEDNLKKGDKI